jgi:hypothetical protein
MLAGSLIHLPLILSTDHQKFVKHVQAFEPILFITIRCLGEEEEMKHLWVFVLIVLFAAACAPSAIPTAAPASAPGQARQSSAATALPPTAAPAATQPPLATSLAMGYPAPPGSASQLAFSPAASGMVVKNAEMELLVADTDRAIDQTTQLLSAEGGYLISSQIWQADGYKYANLNLGMPSARFEDALTRVRKMAIQVIRENATGQDVTSAYVDLQSRLTNLDATSARVRDFLKDAKTTEDSLRINQQLSDLEAQMEQVKGQMHYYEGRSAYSTLTLSLSPQKPTPTATLTPTPTPVAQWNPGKTFGQASSLLVNSAQTIFDGLIWLVVALGPYLLAMGLAIFVLRRVMKRPAAK